VGSVPFLEPRELCFFIKESEGERGRTRFNILRSRMNGRRAGSPPRWERHIFPQGEKEKRGELLSPTRRKGFVKRGRGLPEVEKA